MSIEFEKDSFLSLKRLSANHTYYNDVFKRAERIASVVFYVLSYIEKTEVTAIHHRNLSDKAMRLHECAIASLTLHEYEAKDGLHDFMQALVALESTIHLASAARVLTKDVDRVITNEIDVLQRTVRNHFIAPDADRFEAPQPSVPAPRRVNSPRATSPRRERPAMPAGDISSDRNRVYQHAPGRVDRIKTVLEAKGEATIKDIAEVITDCSEKTIQRDLNSLIESGEVIRHGERRWSRYQIAQS